MEFNTESGPKFSIRITLSNARPPRENKGNSLLELPEDYCIIDIETTGLSSSWDEIIELSALKCAHNEIVDSFSELVQPRNEIDEFIQQLTGITNDMVANADPIEAVLPRFLDFVGNSVLIAHNAHFDINFLYDTASNRLDRIFSNNFVDTMRIFRRLHPDLEHHRLQDMAEFYKIEYSGAHRAANDCHILKKSYDAMLAEIITNHGSVHEFLHKCSRGLRTEDVHSEKTKFDTSHPLYGKVVVFTGTLEKMARKDAMQIVADLGGINGNDVTKKTNYLVLGNNDYCTTIKDGKSRKQKKAESLILAGNDIQIMPENVFYDLVL